MQARNSDQPSISRKLCSIPYCRAMPVGFGSLDKAWRQWSSPCTKAAGDVFKWHFAFNLFLLIGTHAITAFTCLFKLLATSASPHCSMPCATFLTSVLWVLSPGQHRDTEMKAVCFRSAQSSCPFWRCDVSSRGTEDTVLSLPPPCRIY